MYETFYGLSGKPFQLNPDPSFFFGSKGHSKAYAYLKYGVYQSEGFIVITGEVGAGKTTLVRALLDELDPKKVVAVQLVSTQLEADDLVRAVATGFGMPTRGVDKSQLLATIEAFLTQLVTENRRALLIVDEAQNLSPRALEELRMLSNFQIGDRALLQSFLIGQPQMRQILRMPNMQQLRQRILTSYHLGPMEETETRAYIEHRLKHVDWKGDPSFDDEAFKRIFDATGGVPRRINTFANRLMLSAYLAQKRQITADDVTAVADEIAHELPAEEPLDDGLGTDLTLPATHEVMQRIDPVVRSFAYSSINARLDRLEKSVNTAIELLKTLTNDRASKPRTGRPSRS